MFPGEMLGEKFDVAGLLEWLKTVADFERSTSAMYGLQVFSFYPELLAFLNRTLWVFCPVLVNQQHVHINLSLQVQLCEKRVNVITYNVSSGIHRVQ